MNCDNDNNMTEGAQRRNPLLEEWHTPHATPPFSRIGVGDYLPAFEAAIAVSRAEVAAIASNAAPATFENTVAALERQGALLERVSGLFFNLREADTSDEMEEVAERVQPALTALSNDIGLDAGLFARVKAVWEGPREGLSETDIRLLEQTYKGFVRSGAALSEEDKALYRQYTEELSAATLRFGRNTLDATNAFAVNITDAEQVAELPEFVREMMAADAAARGEKGWTVTLKTPSYLPFMTYSSQRGIKERLYRAYNSRALGGEWDNGPLIERIVTLRGRIARLLGYDTYADYVLAERMAGSTAAVRSFLEELRTATLSWAHRDVETVAAYAREQGLTSEMMPWDWAYYTERYKSAHYAVDDEQVKPYLRLENVVRGVFLLAERLYGLHFNRAEGVDVYHPDVEAYEVTDADGSFLAVLYLDFFPRASKRSGAWMTEFRGTSRTADGVETRPLVSLVMNFTRPTASTPSLLTFDELTTLLHEFGHALHGMLARGEYESLNGTNVCRDFVELPSQMMEYWATEKEYLDLWAEHYLTGERIPADLVGRIVAAKNYLAAYANVRQVSFGLIDMAWHTLRGAWSGSVEAFEREAARSVQVMPAVEHTAMSTSFTHIFAGGYAAGYYGYKWSEVLAADAFSLFRERGIFDRATAASFRHLLEQGDQRPAMDIYVEFRGHRPATEALIREMGIGTENGGTESGGTEDTEATNPEKK